MRIFYLVVLTGLLGQCSSKPKKEDLLTDINSLQSTRMFSISGLVKFCYNEENNQIRLPFTIALLDSNATRDSKRTMRTDSLGYFKFDSLTAGKYVIRTNFPVDTDTLLMLDKDIDSLILCTDDLFKPVPPDSLLTSINAARSDLRNGRFKVYRMGTYQTYLTEMEGNLNGIIEQVREKYQCDILEAEGDYMSRDGVIKLEKCLAYNRTIREELRINNNK